MKLKKTLLSVITILTLSLASGLNLKVEAKTGILNAKGQSITYDYTGKVQTVLLAPGKYKLEAYGAQGGDARYSSSYWAYGGKGGYTSGDLNIYIPTKLYIYVGAMGQDCLNQGGSRNGGWNGGGRASDYSGSGGGATDFSLKKASNDSSWEGTEHLYSRILVAGGGGGAHAYGSSSSSYRKSGGAGGGQNGATGYSSSCWSSSYRAYGGSQSSGGSNNSGWGGTGSFGYGGSQSNSYISGGGGGWYGGAAGAYHGCAGGGGSSYVLTADSYKPGSTYTDRVNSTYYLTNTTMQQGNRSGNGLAKVTCLEIHDENSGNVNYPGDLPNKGNYKDFNYNGSIQTINLGPGKYKLEAWGGRGYTYTSYYPGGKGGYAYGEITLITPTTLYVVPGGAGIGSSRGYNGGGYSSYASGGGASHVAMVSGTLNNLSNNKESVLIVAGGGGGGNGYNGYSTINRGAPGGDGGGLTGGADTYGSRYTNSYYVYAPKGGTQTGGGAPGYSSYNYSQPSGSYGKFGQGGDYNTSRSSCGGGGGGGWYGGGGGNYETSGYNIGTGGAGGSSYIDGLEKAGTRAGTNDGNGRVRITVVDRDVVTNPISGLKVGDVLYYDYTARNQLAYLPEGKYKLEAYGGSGGNGYYSNSESYPSYGGKGGYASVEINLIKPQRLYIMTGGAGSEYRSESYPEGGTNGGGKGYYGGGGGGATHIALYGGPLESLEAAQNSIILVAGGGGGGSRGSSDQAYQSNGGYGGGEEGGSSFYTYNQSNSDEFDNNYVSGGNQNGPGVNFTYNSDDSYRPSDDIIGSFGKGRDYYTNYQGGGGGGFYGGTTAYGKSYVGGSGGSGFINKARTNNGILLNGNSLIPGYKNSSETYGNTGNGKVKITVLDKIVSSPKYFEFEDFKTFNYKGSQDEILLNPGLYLMEAYGAQGGDAYYDDNYKSNQYGMAYGGKGGYASGIIKLDVPTKIYINVGQRGQDGKYNVSPKSNTYNGGGGASNNYAGSGGGATSFSLVSGQLQNLESNKDKIILVAGGGGGASWYSTSSSSSSYISQGGYGGGTEGGPTRGMNSYNNSYRSYGAGSSYPGTTSNYYNGSSSSSLKNNKGKFGLGGRNTENRSGCGGGGGGYYGGASGAGNYIAGSGGSGYANNSLINPQLLSGNEFIPSKEKFNQIRGNNDNGFAKISKVKYNEYALQHKYNIDVKEFNYNGQQQVVDLEPGEYLIEAYGAQGGNMYTNYGGGGAYVAGVYRPSQRTRLYLNIGGQPRANSQDAGYNGGGRYRGGGATHISTRSGLLKDQSSYINNLILVAGGGGGAAYMSNANDSYSWSNIPGSGGIRATGGYRIWHSSSYYVHTGHKGTQNKGGTYGYNNWSNYNGQGSFGLGGTYGTTSYHGGGGGGGGYYGGGAGTWNANYGFSSGGGGGSSFISSSISNTKDYTGLNHGNGKIKITSLKPMHDGLYSPYNDIDLPTNILDKENVISITLKDINRTDLNDYQISKDTAIQCIPLLDWYLDSECTKKVDQNTKFSETTVLYTNSTTLPVSVEKYKDSFQKMMKIISSQPNKEEYAKLINANNTNGSNVSYYNMKIIFDNEAGDIQFKEFLNGGFIPAFKELLNNNKILSIYDENFNEVKNNSIADDKLKAIILASFNINETNLIKNLDKKHGSFMINIGENPNNPTLLQFSIDFDIQSTHQDYGHITFKQGNGRKPIAPIDIPVGTILTKEMLPQLVHSSWRIGNVNGPEAIGIQITEDLVLYEKFDDGEVTVKFKTANNRPAPNNIKVRYGTRLGSSGATLPQLQGSKWEYNGKDANGMLIGSNDIDGIPVSGDVTLVEKFTTNVHTISFYNPYSNDFMDDLVVSHGYKISSDILPTAVGGKWFYNGVDPTRSTVSVTQDITLVYSKENSNGNVTITTISRDGYSKAPITLPVGTVLSKSNLPDPNGVPKKFKQWVTNDKLKENPFEQPLYRNITIRMLYEGEF